MTDKIALMMLVCTSVVLFFLFLIFCYKRVFLENLFSLAYVLIWSIVTLIQTINSTLTAKGYLVFSLFVAATIVCIIMVGRFLKKYLRTLFSSLIELSYDEKCASKVVLFRDAMGTRIGKGYIIYVYSTENIYTYHSLEDITLERHRKIALRLNRIDRKSKG